MDDITRKVSEMYSRFPYPSPLVCGQKFSELVNLLRIFSMEANYDLDGKSVLDAGTGTGHRLIEAAATFKKTRFVAVDISQTSLNIARGAAAERGVKNVEFKFANVMEGFECDAPFDVVLSMGVVHHLPDPARGVRNLVANLTSDGILFLYVYGQHGGRERMRRKQIVSLLLGPDGHNFERGLTLVKELGFDSFEYGWNQRLKDEASLNSMIVDAYLNVSEHLFDAPAVFDLMSSSGLDHFLFYGLTFNNSGCLFESRLNVPADERLPLTGISQHLASPMLTEAYEQLTLSERYRLIDLLLEPNGYTVMGLRDGTARRLPAQSRIRANSLRVRECARSAA